LVTNIEIPCIFLAVLNTGNESVWWEGESSSAQQDIAGKAQGLRAPQPSLVLLNIQAMLQV
jgi:hypothetical protein